MGKAFEIGKPYRTARLAARGGLAEVYQAENELGQAVAIKRLHPHLWFDRAQREKFLREIPILRSIDWPQIPALLDASITEEEAYFVMPWEAGEPFAQFRDRISSSVEKEKFAVLALRSLLATLNYLQALPSAEAGLPGLVHADLNPNNLLVTNQGEVTVLDFSCAVWLAEKKGYHGGTWGYMPVAQIKKETVSLQSDLFAAGALFAELLCGKRLFGGDTTFEIFRSTYDFQSRHLNLSSDPGIRDVLSKLFEGTGNPSETTAQLIACLDSRLSAKQDYFFR